MIRVLVVLCATALVGCAANNTRAAADDASHSAVAQEQQLFEQRDKMFKPQLNKYSECNEHAAKAIAFQQGDPVSLALAARGLCARFELELEHAIKNAYGDIVLPSDVSNVIEQARQNVLERNAAEIVAYRAARTSAPPRPKPPKTYDY
jgi:adenylate kinase